MKNRTLVGALLAVATSLLPSYTHAQLTWDADSGTSGPQDGSGSWNASTDSWWNGTATAPFTSGSSAVIGAGVAGTYTIDVSGTFSNIPSLSFTTDGYTLSSQTLALISLATAATNSVQVSPGVTATIGQGVTIRAQRNGSNGNTIRGGGTLIFEAGSVYENRNSLNGGVIISEGTTVEFRAGSSGTFSRGIQTNQGTLNVTGGYLNFSQSQNSPSGLVIGNSAAGEGTVNITSGTVDANLSASASISSVTFSSSGTFAGGTLNLNGGTLITRNIGRNPFALKSVVNWNGGTIRVSVNASAGQRASFFTSGTAAFADTATNGVFIGANGAIMDTNGQNDIFIGVPLNHDSNVVTDGGFTLADSGTTAGKLTFSGTSNYNGATRIERGTLALDATGELTATSGIEIGASGVFDVSAKPTYAATVPVTFAGSGDTIGFLNGAELSFGTINLTLTALNNGTYDIYNTTSPVLAITGIGFVRGTTTGNLTDNGSGVWSFGDGDVEITFDQATGLLTVVPEPSTVAMLALGGVGGLLWLRRRRR